MVRLSVDKILALNRAGVFEKSPGDALSHALKHDFPPRTTQKQATPSTSSVQWIEELGNARTTATERNERRRSVGVDLNSLRRRVEHTVASAFAISSRPTAKVQLAKALYCAQVGKSRL